MSGRGGNLVRAYFALVLVAIALVGFTAILARYGGGYFEPYFGALPPLIVVSITVLLGIASLWVLRVRGGFEVYAPTTSFRGIRLSVAMATAFAGVAILADLGLGFPRDLNVPRPESLLFYPVMGFVAEIVLQVFPLAVLLTVLNRLVEDVSAERRIRISIVAVSLLEPIFQVTVGSTGRPLLDGFVFLHVFAFCLVQLAVFRRFDFVSMYVFRLVYYLYWHIIWGYFR